MCSLAGSGPQTLKASIDCTNRRKIKAFILDNGLLGNRKGKEIVISFYSVVEGDPEQAEDPVRLKFPRAIETFLYSCNP